MSKSLAMRGAVYIEDRVFNARTGPTFVRPVLGAGIEAFLERLLEIWALDFVGGASVSF